MQLPSFYQSENPLFRFFGARGFLFAFLLACLCELHRIRIVQAEMGLAGSRTSFSFPPNRKPSFLSAIFLHMPSCLPACTSYPAGHRLWLAVFIPWLRVRGHGFSFEQFLRLCRSLGRHSPHDVRLATGDCTPDNSVQNGNGTEIGEAHYGLVSCQLFGKGINLGYGEDIRYIEEFLAKNVPSKEES